MLSEVLKQIEQRDRFVLTSHARPDGDAIGSALACRQILRSLGKKAEVVLHDSVPRIYRRLPFADEVVQADRVNGEYEAAIILECDSVQRTRLADWKIIPDQHRSSRERAAICSCELDRPQAVATAELVYRLAREAGAKDLSGDRDLPLHRRGCGHGLIHVRRHQRAHFRVARELVHGGRRSGAHVPAASTSDTPLRRCVYWGRRCLTLHRDGTLAWISVSQEQMARCSAKEEDCEGLVNYALSIHDAQVAAFFRELPDGTISRQPAQQGRTECRDRRGKLRWRRTQVGQWLLA